MTHTVSHAINYANYVLNIYAVNVEELHFLWQIKFDNPKIMFQYIKVIEKQGKRMR